MRNLKYKELFTIISISFVLISGCVPADKTGEAFNLDFINSVIESAPETSAWTVLTEDNMYLLQDFGTAPGMRPFAIWQVDNEEMIFSGNYFGVLKLNGNTIEIVYQFMEDSTEDLDAEIRDFVDFFLQNNPVPPSEMVLISQETGLSISVIIFCEFDIDTRIRKINRAEYILTQ